MKEFSKLLKESIEIFGVDFTQSELQLLENFADQMAEANETHNLSGIKEPEDIRKKHFLDSISCIPAMGDFVSGKAIDIGTGAGFPGLVIKILTPQINFTLVEKKKKKTAFIDRVIDHMKLE